MDWPAKERLLWEAEMERSTRDYEAAMRDGLLASDSPGRQELLIQRCRALIALSRQLCAESRSLPVVLAEDHG